jgi:phosphatidylserine/phosphatidylglycerophosphate/cardiolipin synthase-like enzyme
LLGGNFSYRYSDNTDGPPRHVRWLDGGLLFPRVGAPVVDAMRAAWSLKQSPALPCGVGTLVMRNSERYQTLLSLLRGARRSIYIEHQYFWVHPAVCQNRVLHTLIERVRHAEQEGTPFHITIVTNRTFHDDGDGISRRLQEMLALCTIHEAFHHIGPSYLTIRVPSSPLSLVHSKLVVVDDRHVLIGSGNIYDASFHSQGHDEIGWVAYDQPDLVARELLPRYILSSEKTHPVSRTDAMTLATQFLYRNNATVRACIHAASREAMIQLPLYRPIEGCTSFTVDHSAGE